jgi:HAD superfamily hydrolase (TIGR01493 family)
MSGLDFAEFDVLTFDCYGTLIDWETGILDALCPVLAAHGADAGDKELLEAYGRHETEAEAGPYRRYREVLSETLRGIGASFGFEPTEAELDRFSGSVGDWPAFPDSAPALELLKQRFRLAVITNCDDDLFAESQRRLGGRVRLGDHRRAGARLQAEPSQLRAGLLDHRGTARARPARGAEPLSRPRSGEGAGNGNRVDRPPARRGRLRGDAAG